MYSMSIISDGLNNITDAGSSVITMIGFKMSQKKVDNDHPWGHGRMEYIAAFCRYVNHTSWDRIIQIISRQNNKSNYARY